MKARTGPTLARSGQFLRGKSPSPNGPSIRSPSPRRAGKNPARSITTGQVDPLTMENRNDYKVRADFWVKIFERFVANRKYSNKPPLTHDEATQLLTGFSNQKVNDEL